MAREHGLEKGAEDDLSATETTCQYFQSIVWDCNSMHSPELGESEPQDEDEFEGVEEREPVDGVDCTFKDTE